MEHCSAGGGLTSGVTGLLDFAGALKQLVVHHHEVLTDTFNVKLLSCNTNRPHTAETHVEYETMIVQFKVLTSTR